MNENQTSADGNRPDILNQTPERPNASYVGIDANTRENTASPLNHHRTPKPQKPELLGILAELEARLLRLELSYKILHELLLDETPYKKTPKLSTFGKKLSPRLQGKYRV